MKNLQKNWIKVYNYFLVAILGLLGFSGCDKVEEFAPEYGMPHAKYELKGKVINSRKGLLSDMQVVVGEIENRELLKYVYYRDTLYTDSKGEFFYKDDYAWPGSKLRAKFTGIQKNGEISIYKPDSIDVDMGELTGASGNWYEGKASKEVTINVKEKEQENAE